MSSPWKIGRTIIEEDQASKSLDLLKEKFERFDEQWVGFSWFLARSPEKSFSREFTGKKQKNEIKVFHLMHRAGDDSCGLVEIAATYTYNDHEVVLLDVSAWKPPKENV